MQRHQSYVICTSPRSGSTLLCTLLREHGGAGFPGSHFHEPSVEKWLDCYGLKSTSFETRTDALKAILRAAIKYGKGTSSIFGLRLQRQSFDFFIRQLAVLYPSLTHEGSRIEAAFGKTLFIHLTRGDKLEQAISYVRAQQSGLWHKAPDGTEIERLSEPKETAYDARAISTQLALFEQMETDWRTWFESQDIKPLRITYDALSAAPYATLVQVLKTLDIECAQVLEATPPTAKLADTTSLEWAARFRSER